MSDERFQECRLHVKNDTLNIYGCNHLGELHYERLAQYNLHVYTCRVTEVVESRE